MTLFLLLLRAAFAVGGRLAPGLAGRAAWRLFTTPTPRPRPLSDAQQRLLGEAEPLDVEYDGQRLAVYRWSPEAASEPGREPRVVLLVHGWADRATVFQSLVPALRRSGFAVVAFDGPAHGASPGRRTNLVDFAGAIQAVARVAGPVYGMVGHSFGAASASLVTAGDPPLAAPAERLVLVAGPNRLRDVIARFAAFVRLPERVVAVMHEEVHRLAGRTVDEITVASAVARAGLPTLVVHDRQDRELPFADAEAVVAALPDARLLATDGLGHRRLLQSPEVVDAIASFFEQGPTSSGSTRIAYHEEYEFDG